MTTRLYLDDSYCFEHDAVVVCVHNNVVILDQTCMYPGGGGQPTDSGTLVLSDGTHIIVTTISKDTSGNILHFCANPVSTDSEGIPCRVVLDKKRRLSLMRYHTALHVVNTVMLRLFDGWITGVGIDADNSHIDFKVDDYSDAMRIRLERETNVILGLALPIKSCYITEEQFKLRNDLLRTLDVVPPVENGRVRVVEIEGFEAQACGGTHVRNTADVGTLSIVKVRSKGRNNRRFYITLDETDQEK